MFPANSRYRNVEIVTWVAPDGREIKYLRRRLPPPVDSYPIETEHTVVQGERLDRIAYEHLGDPELFWRLCDANDGLRPRDLTAEIGRRLRIPLFLGG